jgi:hypothetical protein
MVQISNSPPRFDKKARGFPSGTCGSCADKAAIVGIEIKEEL